MKEIPLTLGRVALVDDADYDKVKDFSWHYVTGKGQVRGYARTTMRIGEGHRKVRMHRFITGAPESVLVDHRDGDGLNNQRLNLRFATTTQNCMNRRINKIKGVRYSKRDKKWDARISSNKQRIYLGQFSSELLAAFAYDRKARELFGEFACTNFHPDYEQAYAEMVQDTL